VSQLSEKPAMGVLDDLGLYTELYRQIDRKSVV